MEIHDWKKKQIKKSHELGGGGGGGKGETTTSMIPVKHVPYFYTVAVQGLAQETVNVAEFTILMLNMEYQFLKLYLLLYDLMVGSELFNDVDSSKLTKQKCCM